MQIENVNVNVVVMIDRRPTAMDLPMAMRFRHLKIYARQAVGVYRYCIVVTLNCVCSSWY